MMLFGNEMPRRKYYRVVEGPCHEVLTRWRSKREELQKQYLAFANSVGGCGYYPGHDDNVVNATAISAVVFDGKLPSGWKPRRWQSFTGVHRGKSTGWPDQRTKIGKEALAAIKKLPLLPSSYGPCREIGFPTSLSYSGRETILGSTQMGVWETMLIGFLRDTFYVAIPDEEAARAELVAKGYTVEGDPWRPLPGMVEILEEEMNLDFARERARKAKESVSA
jgi:hypothetical protein